MSLLDDVSIVVTPNGYKAGELYAVVPVPTEGADVIVDGNFPDGSTAWALNGWTISGNAANGNGLTANLIQSISGSTNKQFLITFTISNYVSGSVIPAFVGNSSDSLVYSSNGTFTEVISSGSDIRFVFYGASFNGSISNVSVKEYTSADMDVTRATAATRVDEDGLVNYAEILGSEQVTGFTNGTTYPFTTFATSGNNITSAIISSAFAGAASNGISVTSGEIYKVTFDYTKNSGDDLRVLFAVSANGAASAISNNVIISASGTYTEYFTITSTTTGYLQMGTGNSGHSLNASITNVSVKEVTRDNVPRIDYTGGGCPHILAEPQRTNLITYSEDFTQWSKEATVTLTPNYSTSPDGTNNATRVQLDADDSIYLSSLGSSKVFSIYVKGVAGETIRISNGVATMFTLTGNWDRLEVFDTSGSSTLISINTYSSATARDIQIWGAQLEESYATSYIPTSGSTVTRNQDIFTRDGIGSLINSTEGVLFLEMAALTSLVPLNNWITISDGTASNQVVIGFETNEYTTARVDVGGSNEAYISVSGDYSQNRKIAFKWKSNDFALWIDGVEVGTDVSGSTIGAGTLNSLQFTWGAGGNYTNGKVKQLQVYNTALTDEQLLQLTGESGTDFYESYAEMAAALTYTIQ